MYSNILKMQGITQPTSQNAPKKLIKMFGTELVLCKDASDSTTSFPHERVQILGGDCVHIEEGNYNVYFCYLRGIIQPLPNSLEKPITVYYVGFHKNYVDMRFLTPQDISRMHIYKQTTENWAQTFARNLLNINTDEMEREPISPFPIAVNNVKRKRKPDSDIIEDDDNSEPEQTSF